MLKEKEIIIDYSPHKDQKTVHNCSKRFRVLVCGRRWGKTTLAVNEIIRHALLCNGSRIFYIAPTYRQSKMIAFNLIREYLPRDFVDKVNLAELSFNLKNGSEIALKGADSPDSLRGVGLDFVVLDEYANMASSVWGEIIRPTLADSGGMALFIGTPKGKNHFYDLYTTGNEQFQSFHYPTVSNPYIPKEEVEQAKKDMPETLFRQEFLAEFLDDETGVFKKVRQCIVGEPKEPELGRYYIMGVDLAKYEDFTVLTVVDSTTRELVHLERFQDVLWTTQKLRIQETANKYNNALVVLDSTGVGDPVADDLRDANISLYYEGNNPGVKFNHNIKMKLVENLAIAIEQRLVTIPRQFEVLIQELMNFEYLISDRGIIRYSAPSGKHDDCVISLALAMWGMRNYLRSAQVINDQHNELVRDRQGRGEVVNALETETTYAGY